MAWNSWNIFGCSINETMIMQIAEAVVSTGLNKYGYEYVNMDDCWAKSRNASGFVEPDPTTFPHGIKYLADYVHSLGLKFGLYSCAGTETCAGRPGSLGYETQDAEQYAAWGADYLKYDNCNSKGLPDPPRYAAMRDALNKTGRPIFFSMCDWTVATAPWGGFTGNSWRTTTDIEANWDSWTNNLDQNGYVAYYAGEGSWNDPDMLEVGNGDLTASENIAHFSLWALIKAPLVLGNDLRSVSQSVLNVITNKEVIAISQDPLGVQGVKISYTVAQDSTFASVVYADKCTGSPAQQFKFDATTGTITSILTSGCLAQFTQQWNCGAGASMGGMLYLQECGANCSGKLQKFSFAGTWQTHFGQGTDMCLETVPKRNGQSDVVMLPCSGMAVQQWSYNNSLLQNGEQCLTVSGGAEVWAVKLSGGSYAVGLFNRAYVPQTITVAWEDVGFSGTALVRDLWQHNDLGKFSDSFSSSVPSLGITFVKVSPQ
jgi:alpha-galactosidase